MGTKITADNLAPALATAITQGGGPKITNIIVTDPSFNNLDDTAVDISGGHIKIIGTGFEDGCQVTIGTIPASSITFTSSTELRVSLSSRSTGTYTVYVTNPDGGSAIRVNGITYSSFPAWSSGSSLGSRFGAFPFEILVSANSDSNVSYSLAPGSSLPFGANLFANGLITGNVYVENETTFNFVLIATDEENQNTNSSFNLTLVPGSLYPTIEGGTITTSGDFKIHTFTSSANLNIVYPGILDSNIWYLVVAGGAGGGGASGGGAGGYLEGNISVPISTINTSFPIIIGAGGTRAGPARAGNGGNSFLSVSPTLLAIGGGGGGVFAVPGNGTTYKGDTGGSGGGSGGNSDTGGVTVPGGAGIPGQGNPGGAGGGNSGSPSGGGGGAGGAGGPFGPGGMTGGVGKQSTITGSAVYYSGGGGGGSFNAGSGAGGLGGGGPGSSGGTNATSGTDNTGGGGGGNGGGALQGSGGSGIVIIRYRYQ